MKHIMSLLQEIEANQIKTNISDKLAILSREINYILLKIKFCETIEKADIYFDLLDKIQLIAATLHYKYGIHLSKSLNHFIINFNQLYDSNERNRLFIEIKNNQHLYRPKNDIVLLKILEDLEQNPTQSNVSPILPFLHEEVNHLLTKIKLCKSIAEAHIYFDLLQKIQNVLAILVFKYDIKVSKSFRDFIYDCDRLDDLELRKYLFKKIKHGYQYHDKNT